MLVEGPDRDSNDAPLYEAMLADEIRVMDRAGHWRRVEETVPLLLTRLGQAGVRARCSCRQDTLSVTAPFERFPLQLQRRVLVSYIYFVLLLVRSIFIGCLRDLRAVARCSDPDDITNRLVEEPVGETMTSRYGKSGNSGRV